ncbi:MAG: hypothetical protein WCO51_10530 [bacterium]|jgi:hypothetical protein
MTLRSLLRKDKPAISPENLRSRAVARIMAYVEANRPHPWCCPVCLKFGTGQEMNADDKGHIEGAIRYQEQLLIEEYGYLVSTPRTLAGAKKR